MEHEIKEFLDFLEKLDDQWNDDQKRVIDVLTDDINYNLLKYHGQWINCAHECHACDAWTLQRFYLNKVHLRQIYNEWKQKN